MTEIGTTGGEGGDVRITCDHGVCCGQNPPAGSDGQHSRAGNNLGLRLALVPPSDGPQSLWYTRPMLMQGRAT